MPSHSSPHPFQRAPHTTLVRLALPVLVSLAAEPITGAVDIAFVGRNPLAVAPEDAKSG